VYRDPSIAPLGRATAELLTYDAWFFPDDRRVFMRHCIAQPGSTTLSIRRAGRLAGYGTIRPYRIGFKVGPLFTDDADLADRLLRALITTQSPASQSSSTGQRPNPAAIALAQAHGMRPVLRPLACTPTHPRCRRARSSGSRPTSSGERVCTHRQQD
jgi:hypothetical protein